MAVRECDTRVRPYARRESRSLCVRVLGRVICDVSGPIGCHLSSRCRRVPPFLPPARAPSSLALSLLLCLFLALLPLPPFILPFPSFPFPSSIRLSLSTTLDATRGRNLIRATLSLSHLSSRNIPSQLNPCDCLPPSFLARTLAGIFSPSPQPSRVRFLFVIVPASILSPLVSSRSFQRRCQWRDRPFFRKQTPFSSKIISRSRLMSILIPLSAKRQRVLRLNFFGRIRI